MQDVSIRTRFNERQEKGKKEIFGMKKRFLLIFIVSFLSFRPDDFSGRRTQIER